MHKLSTAATAIGTTDTAAAKGTPSGISSEQNPRERILLCVK
jgi:hypothetical protein